MSEKISHLPATSPPLSFARVRLRETDMGAGISHVRSASRNPIRIQKLALPCCELEVRKPGNYQFSNLAGLDELSRFSRFTDASAS